MSFVEKKLPKVKFTNYPITFCVSDYCQTAMVRIELMTIESGPENLYHCANLGWIDLQVVQNPNFSRNKLFICQNINFEGERAKKGHVAGLWWILQKLKKIDKRTNFQHFPTFFKIKINNKTNCFLHEN